MLYKSCQRCINWHGPTTMQPFNSAAAPQDLPTYTFHQRLSQWTRSQLVCMSYACISTSIEINRYTQ